MYFLIQLVLYLHDCYRVGGRLPGEHYDTLVLFVVYFVLKMFKNIGFYIETRCTQGVRVFFFPGQECNLVTVLVWINLALLL